jgi:fucose permease
VGDEAVTLVFPVPVAVDGVAVTVEVSEAKVALVLISNLMFEVLWPRAFTVAFKVAPAPVTEVGDRIVTVGASA